jgi:hypothetical protein
MGRLIWSSLNRRTIGRSKAKANVTLSKFARVPFSRIVDMSSWNDGLAEGWANDYMSVFVDLDSDIAFKLYPCMSTLTVRTC